MITGKRKILLADSGDVLAETQRLLKRRGDMEVHAAASAESALDIHRRENVHFIVADLDLPVMGGDTLCQVIRSDEELKRVYVSLMCGGRASELERCGRCMANNYIKLPLNAEELLGRIVRVLDLHGNRAERVLVKVSVDGSYNHECFYCVSQNISVTGMLFETEKTLAKGDHVSCSFFLPDAERVTARGLVVRVARGSDEHKHAYGIEFVEISDQGLGIELFIEGVMGSRRAGGRAEA